MAFEREAGWQATKVERQRLRIIGPRMRWVAVSLDRAVIGVAHVEIAPPEFCYVSHLVIKTEYRGRKIGRWFVEKIEKFAFGCGVHLLLLTPYPGSEPFYEALDFVADPHVDGVLKKALFFRHKLFLER